MFSFYGFTQGIVNRICIALQTKDTKNRGKRPALCPWLWWKFDSSVSMSKIFQSQLAYNDLRATKA
jgi:hypothetical protein